MIQYSMPAVERRHEFLIQAYQANKSAAFDFGKLKKEKRAARMIRELRERYGYFQPVQYVSLGQNLTLKDITENGKYALD